MLSSMLMGIALYGRRFMTTEEWRANQEQRQSPQYAHFDYRVSLPQCWSYITDPNNIAKHGFYPFIHYNIKSRKLKNGKKVEPKIRSIYYAAHLDGWIYKYYAYLLNEQYNKRVNEEGLASVAVAYRTDLKKSNVQFAHEAFTFIRSCTPCHVMIGDFTDFFDTLNHQYLKQRLCSLLDIDRLPPDYYSVFKNVTKFSYWELENLLAFNGLNDTRKDRKILNRKTRALAPQTFHSNKAEIKPNPRRHLGVPQGSPISAVLANIYMLNIDKAIYEFVEAHGGLYMRYSDDFMIVLPDKLQYSFAECYGWIDGKLKSVPDLTLQKQKTKLFYISDGKVVSCTQEFIPEVENSKNIIDFLGFSFDGKNVTIRDKTIAKYYCRMYRKIKTITQNSGCSPKGKRISCAKLYEQYSHKGTRSYKRDQASKQHRFFSEKDAKGNFFDYVEHAQADFVGDPIDRGTKNHMRKIRKRLKGNQKK